MRAWCVIAMVVMTCAKTALGCGSCVSLSGSELSLPHPRAIEIAVATRAAIEAEQLKPLSRRTAQGRRPTAREIVQRWIDMRSSRRPASKRPSGTLHVVLIDTSETLEVQFRPVGLVIVSEESKHSADATMVSTLPALKSLLEGKHRLAQLLKTPLVVIEGDSEIAELFDNSNSK